MIYLQKQIKFKKQSQTLTTAIKDKQIEQKKKTIKSLLKADSILQAKLSQKKQIYTRKRQVFTQQYNKLLAEQESANNSQLLRLMIRKIRLQAFQKPQIKHHINKDIQKYLRGLAQYVRHAFICKLGGIHCYYAFNKIKWILQRVFSTYFQLQKIIVMKHITIWVKNNYYQNIMITIKKISKQRYRIRNRAVKNNNKSENKSTLKENASENYLLQIYSTSGQWFALKKVISRQQYQTFLKNSESLLKNIILTSPLKSSGHRSPFSLNMCSQMTSPPVPTRIQFLSEYLSNPQKLQKVKKLLNVYRFQIRVIKEIKKIVYFRCFKVRDIFQAVYGVSGYQGLQMEVLVEIKKKEAVDYEDRIYEDNEDIICANALPNQLISMNATKNLYLQSGVQYQYPPKCYRIEREKKLAYSQYQQSIGQNLSQNTQQGIQQGLYTLYCQPIKSYDQKFMFLIQNDIILRNSQQSVNQFMATFFTKYMIQLDVKKLIHTSKQYQKQMQASSKSPKNLHSLSKGYRKQKLPPKFIQVLQFSSEQNLRKIIQAQSLIRASLCRKKYLSRLAAQKKSMEFRFNVRIYKMGNIMISTYVKKGHIIFFVECLCLTSSVEKTNKPNDTFLHYPCKYWHLVSKFTKSQQFQRIIKKYLIWQIQESIDNYFQEMIEKYEKQQQLINELKPINALNRLRRFFMRIFLRIRIKKYSIGICKIERNFGSFCIMVRKSVFMKNIAHVYLYPLNKQLKYIQNQKDSHKNPLGQQQDHRLQSNKKLRYTPLSMFLQNALTLCQPNMKLIKRKNFPPNKISSKSLQSQFYITETKFLLKPLHIEYISKEYKFIERLRSISLLAQEVIEQIQEIQMEIGAVNGYGDFGGQDDEIRQSRAGNRTMDVYKSRTKNKSRSKFRSNYKFTRKLTRNGSELIYNNSSNISGTSQPSEPSSQDNTIFYSIYKTIPNNYNPQQQSFFIQLFLIISIVAENNEYFKSVHKQEISKNDVANSGWSFIYRIIGQWARTSGWCVDDTEAKGRLGFGLRESQQPDQDTGINQIEIIQNN